MSGFSLLQNSIERIEFARRYTKQFLVGLTPEEWFWTPTKPTEPAGFITHVAWQVGHVGVSQYNLCLRRIRGRTEADASLMPDDFIECFRLGSVPVADASKYPMIGEIERTFTAVHETILAELSQYSEAELEVPVEQPIRCSPRSSGQSVTRACTRWSTRGRSRCCGG